MKHREKHPVDVPGCFGCHLCSIAIRRRVPADKQTVHHTDTAVVTETQHFKQDRQDVNVRMRDAVRPTAEQSARFKEIQHGEVRSA